MLVTSKQADPETQSVSAVHGVPTAVFPTPRQVLMKPLASYFWISTAHSRPMGQSLLSPKSVQVGAHHVARRPRHVARGHHVAGHGQVLRAAGRIVATAATSDGERDQQSREPRTQWMTHVPGCPHFVGIVNNPWASEGRRAGFRI